MNLIKKKDLEDIECTIVSISRNLSECKVSASKDELRRGYSRSGIVENEANWCAVGKIRTNKDVRDDTRSWKKTKEEQYKSALELCELNAGCFKTKYLERFPKTKLKLPMHPNIQI